MLRIDLLISLVIALIMFGIGLSLNFSDFKRIAKSPKPIILGLSFQMILLPILAFLIAILIPIKAEWKVGLFILAICPGGTMSNFISYIVKADVALSLSLTSINSFLIIFTVPLLSNFALHYFINDFSDLNFSMFFVFYQIILLIILPSFLGIFFNYFKSSWSNKIQAPIKIINSILLAVVFGVKFFANKTDGGSDISFNDLILIVPFVAVFHLAALLLSYFGARKLKISNFQATTIGIESGLQNTTLALLITGSFLANNEMTKPILVFAIFTFFSTLIFAYIAITKGANHEKITH